MQNNCHYQMNYNNYNNLSNNNNQITLYDCFFYNQKIGFNQIHCNLCNQSSLSFNSTHIYSSPKVLILILNRNKNTNDVHINLDEKINITPFVLQKDTPQLEYNLYGVITQICQTDLLHILFLCVKAPLIINGINIMIQ